MYSRYVPGTNGNHEKRPVASKPPPPHRPPHAKEAPCPPPPKNAPCPPPNKEPCRPQEKPKLPGFLEKLLPQDMEIGDLLVLLILVLVLLDGEEDSLSILLAIGLFFFMK